ncbi:aspartate/glutamate racemase family protein [Bosea sp. (in: a-proteobacteria)]|uniref:aspartate/glutamate racemase family protein n=1 Tax=Bosea sp. (in: a-proteobacteria) TaxID=1871050 RepID=UPI0026046B34|nr:aspartate/glutamate racemase family protein [Bosea sp. (in: a-proteobacteria)]MCO5091850.1 aspartate/glutamate racemase family protein [Bosea sp. (in: a-proteobacteria)]
MPVYKLLPQPQAYGYPIGILLLDLIETHVPGDTAHAATYGYPVLFKVVTEARVDRVTHGDRAVEAALVEAARELERAGVKAIATNCGFMIHYQEAVRAAVRIPVFLSSLLQLPTIARCIRPDQTIGIMTAFKDRLTPAVLSLAGLPDGRDVVINSIETTPEFMNMGVEDLDTDAFEAQLTGAAGKLFSSGKDIGALLLECAVFTPYAAALQKRFSVPVFDFISLIDYAYYVTHRRRYA